jgi:hypothetical protein
LFDDPDVGHSLRVTVKRQRISVPLRWWSRCSGDAAQQATKLVGIFRRRLTAGWWRASAVLWQWLLNPRFARLTSFGPVRITGPSWFSDADWAPGAWC